MNSDPVDWWRPGSPALYNLTGNNPASWYAAVELLVEAGKRVKFEGAPVFIAGANDGMFAINAVYAMLPGYAIESS